jgi:acyl transferase domain-containing protein/thioesterase domain-containing protein
MASETSKLTPLQRAVAALEHMRGRLSRLEEANSAPIAIVGIGCRFPGGVQSPEDYWRVLSDGVDAVTPVPASRWNVSAYYDSDPDAPGKMYTGQGAFVDAVDEFDAEFFGISPREAEELDPRQRLLLETSWEALERAGIVPRALEGSRTGVFVGIEESDYGTLTRTRLDGLTAYTGLGRMMSTAAGRLSFVLGLQGPCVALDTACSSSLVALHLACQSLRAQECRLALAGGVSLLLSPLSFVALSRTRALAPDGRCKTFSARADGYGRGEGCAMLLLKRLSDAEADGDEIVAVIRGSAVAHDGTSSGITVPNGSSQRQVLGDALENARLGPRDIQYVECHGTGTSLGDPIEVQALGAVYGVDRPKTEPLLIGSAKTNIGHLEAASGVAGLLKVVMSLRHGAIPASLHFDQPNPHIAWGELPVEVVTALRPWPASERPLRAGVSAFGISGTNAHVIVEAAAPRRATPEPANRERERPQQLIVVSAKNEASLRAQVHRLSSRLTANGAALGDVARALSTRRSAFRHRLAFPAADAAAAIDVLERAAAGDDVPGAVRGVAASAAPSVAFMFTGGGAQYAGMGRRLYETEPVFRGAVDRAAEQLSGVLPTPLLSVLFPSAGESSPIDDIEFMQPAMFAVSYALAVQFRAWGVEPAYLIGHSLGEYVAACLAGVFSFENALKLVTARGRLMQALPERGAMMSIEASEAQVAAAISGHHESVSIAAINGPTQVVISGDEAIVSTVGAAFAAEGVRTKRLRVSHASHSPLMRPMIEAFRAVAESVSYAEPRIPLVSNVTGRLEVERFTRAAYWTDHVLRPVRMHSGLWTILEAGATQVLEIGPTPVLCGMASVSAPDATASFIPSLRRDRDDTESMLESLARLWTGGVAVDWAAFDGHRQRGHVSLPTYAFDRQRHWLKDEQQHPLSGIVTSGALGELVSELSVGPAHQPYLADHVVYQRVVVPGAFYLSVLLAIASDRLGARQVTLRDVEFVRPMLPDGGVRVQVRLAADRRFTVASDVTHVQGTLEVGARSPSRQLDLESAKRDAAEPVSIDAAYAALDSLSIIWGPQWQWMTEAYQGSGFALVRLAPPSGALGPQAPLHPCVIDNAFGAAVLSSLNDTTAPRISEPWLPYAVEAFRLHRPASGPVWCRNRRRPDSGSTEIVRFDLVFWDDSGALVAEIDGFAVKRATRRAFLAGAGGPELPLFGLFWRPAPLPGSRTLEGGVGQVGVLAVGDGDPTASMLAEAGVDVVAAPRDPAELAAWLDCTSLDTLVCVWGATDVHSSPDAVANERVILALHVLQAVLRSQARPRRMLWVTTNASELDEGGAVDPASTSLWGLGRVAAQEHPELALRLVDLRDGRQDGARRLVDELAAADDEPQIALGARDRFALRLDRMPRDARSLPLPDAPSYRLVCDSTGGLNGLAIEPSARRAPGDGTVEVEVEATGLNFRDIVNVLGMVGYLGPLGGEVAGVVTAVGAGVTHRSVGDRVMGLATGGFAKYVTVDPRWMVARPASLSPEQAAALPVVFLSAWGAIRAADIRPGERVLVHSAAGGVGMAAIQLVHRLGAEVYGTASPAKWDAVRSLGVAHVSNSRTLDFADEIRAAGGVDVVINTLAGEFIDASLSILRPGGRFVELGKTDLRDPAAVGRSYPGVRYEVFDLAKLAVDDPEAVQAMLVELAEGMASHALKPLPVRVWPIRQAPVAFEHMARAGHVGKIVLAADGASPPRFRRDGSALITGGLGALGLETARWLVRSEQVGRIVLTGRRSPSAEALAAIEDLRAAGATIEIALCDVADLDALRAVLATFPQDRPLRVVVHAAGILDDDILTEQTSDRFAAVLAPKVSGAWNLHRLTEHLDLDAFVLFSSVAGWLGSVGQSNYAAANAFLDGLASHRRARGLCATSIAWGAWSAGTAGLGMTARLSDAERTRMRKGGLDDISPSLGVALLSAALDRDRASIGAFPVDVARFGDVFGASVPPLLRSLVGEARSVARPGTGVDDALRGPSPAASGVAAQLRALSADARIALVQSWIAGEVSRVMRIGAVPLDQPLQERGLDSLMAVEVRNGIAAKIGKPLPVTLLFDHPTIGALSRHILDKVVDLRAEDVVVAPAAPTPALAPSLSEPIAIVGIGCRFPGGVVDLESFWKLLEDGVDAIGEVPKERWDVDAYFDPNPDAPGKMYTRWGGFLSGLDRFDAGFFGISGREARSVDPQERLMLEASWEALEQARLTSEMLVDSSTGVYMGVCNHEYSVLAMSDIGAIDAYSGLGTAHSAMVGRISYCLGLRGPNLSLDTACSSSLVAVHLACQALRAGECRVALAGGVNTILFPEGSVYFSRLRALSPTGRCRPFSAGADGFVRSEGVGVVVLERLSDALANGREILAVIRGTAVNQDGRSQGLTAPSGPAQQDVIRRALGNAGLAPHEVDYVECHGTGTSLGDPIEAHALAAAYQVGRPTTSRLAIGSVKGNFGHTEGAAGVAGLIKAVLSVRRGELPASLHAATLNPHIPWDALPLDVVQDRRTWPQQVRPRRAGVSAFGFSGTNAHVIVEQAPSRNEPAPTPRVSMRAVGPVILTVSAKSVAALRGQASKLAAYLARPSEADLADVAHALRTDRTVFAHRLAIEAADRASAAARLSSFASEGAAPAVWAGEARDGSAPVAFLFTGQGAQYAGMGRGLYEGEPVFREAIDRCAALFARELPRPLISVLYESGSTIDETSLTQPALFAVGYALAELWKHWGVTPSAVLGHSIGEYAAAHLAGVFSLEDAVRLVAARGRLMQALPERGAMVMIGASEAHVLPAVAQASDRVSIAAVNGPEQTVISGDEQAVLTIAEGFAASGVRTKRLRVSHAFHSPLMAPMLDAFRAVARSVAYSNPAIRMVSTAGDAVGVPADVATAEYWVEHVRVPVRLFGGLRTLLDGGLTRFLELGPAPILSAIGAESFPESPASWLASLRQDRDDARIFRESAARLWVSGVRVVFRDVDAASCGPVPLPTYAFERERHWLDRSPALAARQGDKPRSHVAPLSSSAQEPGDAPPAAAVSRADLARLSAVELGEWVRREVAATVGASDPSAVNPSRELFEQGLDSLLLVELRGRLSAGLGRALPMQVLFKHRTVDALTAHLAVERTRVQPAPVGSGLIVPIAASPVLFLLPGALGAGMDFFYLGQHLRPDWTVFALDYPGVHDGGELHTDIRTLAGALAAEIDRFAAEEVPIALGGHSFGGGVAWEVCHELLARGRAVELVVMFDSFCPLGLDGYADVEQAVYVERLERVPRVRALFAANSVIAKNWRSSSRLPADVRVVQFKVPEKDPDAMKTATVADPRDVWAEYAAPGTYVTEQVPGTHGSFVVQSPEVDELALRVKEHLAAARDRVAARRTVHRHAAVRP